ncbi:MAG: hypothetical protein ACLTTJ_14165 [Blautia sp.]
MNEELFNEAAKSNVLTKKHDRSSFRKHDPSSSISFINWTIEVPSTDQNRLERGGTGSQMKYSGEVYTTKTFQKFVAKDFLFLPSPARFSLKKW